MPEKTIVQEHKANFNTLKRAIRGGHAALMECQLKSTGEKVAVICAMVEDDEGMFNVTPFAMFFNGNPYEMLNPPDPDGGFQETRSMAE